MKLEIERGQRVFPKSGKAWDIANALEDYCRDNGVEIVFNAQVTEILTLEGKVYGVKGRDFLIRGSKSEIPLERRKAALEEAKAMMSEFGFTPTIFKLLEAHFA